jgi:hypothetical protein
LVFAKQPEFLSKCTKIGDFFVKNNKNVTKVVENLHKCEKFRIFASDNEKPTPKTIVL